MNIAPWLHEKVFSPDFEKVAIRDGFGNGLLDVANKDERVVGLCADLTESTRMQAFAEAYPKRFVEVGIAEQNMSGVASGMAAMGKIPFMASYAIFSPGRNWEQIRTTIAYNNQPVKIVGSHAGVTVGEDGGTHQMLEDIALMRAMPNMMVLSPADAHEAYRATCAAAAYPGPVYIRLSREKTAVITVPDAPFKIGEAYILMSGNTAYQKKVGIIATGDVTYEALIAAKELNDKHEIGASLMNLPTIKPLDADGVRAFAMTHDVIVTVENHMRAGGMGSAVAEYLSEVHPIRVVRIGVDDVFGQSGTAMELIKHYKLDASSIVARVREAVSM